MLRVAALLPLLVAACAGTRSSPAHVGTYCVGCAGGEASQVLLRPAPLDAQLASLQLNLGDCPEQQPTVLTLGGAQGVYWQAKARAGAPETAAQFSDGEVNVESCTMQEFHGSYWMQRDDGTRIEGRIDGPLNVDTKSE